MEFDAAAIAGISIRGQARYARVGLTVPCSPAGAWIKGKVGVGLDAAAVPPRAGYTFRPSLKIDGLKV